MPIVIVGGGIGGLTAAAAIRRVGREVVVVEAAAELREIGAAISLGVNAMTALRRLGLADEVLRVGKPIGRIEIRSSLGTLLCGTDLDDLARRRGVPGVVVLRADLQSILAGAAGAEVVRLGARCVALDVDEGGASARLGDGGSVRGEAVVGADGVHSVVRRSVGHVDAVRHAGYVAWRAVTRFDLRDAAAAELWGRGRRFGYAPLPDGRVYWYATRNAAPGAAASAAARSDVLAEFADWSAPVPALIESTDAASVLRHDIVDRPPTRRWGEGRVTLLGDAAHAMTPNLGQGACQAIEDAVTLAKHLDGATDVAVALRAYEAERIPRTSAIVRESWRLGRVGQLEGPVLCALRDWAVRLTPDFVTRRSIERVQGWTP